jgi:hypothetical protein
VTTITQADLDNLREAHDARVTELLDANNRFEQRARDAERKLKALLPPAKEALGAFTNNNAFDWSTLEQAIAKVELQPAKPEPKHIRDGMKCGAPHGVGDAKWCRCHAEMGNDFYFLPIDSCLHAEKST